MCDIGHICSPRAFDSSHVALGKLDLTQMSRLCLSVFQNRRQLLACIRMRIVHGRLISKILFLLNSFIEHSDWGETDIVSLIGLIVDRPFVLRWI